MKKDDLCVGCKFYKPDGNSKGFCRLNPPVVILRPVHQAHIPELDELESVWPRVPYDNFCSSHERKSRHIR